MSKKKVRPPTQAVEATAVAAAKTATNGAKRMSGTITNPPPPPPDSQMIEPPAEDRKRHVTLKVVIYTLLTLYVAYRIRSLFSDEKAAIKLPSSLLNYAEFKAQYPRLKQPSEVEESRRHLLFILDLIIVGTHNINYLSGKETYLSGQTPFAADRTIVEQRDIVGQLEQFNLTQIMINLNKTRDPIDSPVSVGSGAPPTGSSKVKSTLKTGNKVSQWFARTIQGDAHFEIPNYPLDAQPDPSSVTHIDADLRYCSGSIQEQGHCGACYAFSWNSFAEWHYCKQSGRQIDFSEQHIIDCGRAIVPGLSGCREGYLTDTKEFSQKLGFHLEADYPYKGKQASQCKRPDGSIKANVVDFTRIQVIREEWEQILREQPIVLQVHLPKDIMSYQQGVHPGTNCDKDMPHGMLLVGYGRDKGIPYWLLKNSMGARWGENGYLRLSRDAPMSQCFRTGFIAKFKFESLDQDAYYDFYDNLAFQEPSVHVVGKPVIGKGVLNWFHGTPA